MQIKSKYTIYELCFSKLIAFAENIDNLMYNSLVSIHDSHAIIFKQMSSILLFIFFYFIKKKKKLFQIKITKYNSFKTTKINFNIILNNKKYFF